MGVGVGSGERRPSLRGTVLRNSETRWYSCVGVNVTKNETKWQEGGSEPNVKVFMSGQEVRRWHQQEGTWMVQPDEKSWPLSILYYRKYQVNSKKLNFMYSTIRPPAHLPWPAFDRREPAHLPPLGPQNSWSSIVYHLSLTLTSFLTHLRFQSSFPLNPLSTTLTLSI